MRDAVTEIQIDNPIARAVFIRWWRSMEAQGYSYGFEALCNVWVGFDDGRADLAKKVLEVVDLPALRELFIREGAYVNPAAPGSPSPAEPPEFRNTKEAMEYARRNNIPAVIPVSAAGGDEPQACWVDPDDPRRVKMIFETAEIAAAFVDNFARSDSVGEESR